MSPADLDLARELAAHPRWEWRAGMVVTGPGWFEHATILETDVDGKPEEWVYRGHLRGPGSPSGDAWDYDNVYPNLDVSATAGVLLAMLWEAQPGAMLRRDPHRAPGADPFTIALAVGGGGRADGRTAGVALARALLAAWGPA